MAVSLIYESGYPPRISPWMYLMYLVVVSFDVYIDRLLVSITSQAG